MTKYGWVLGLNPKKAMNVLNANVQAHLDHCSKHGKVFWDRNMKFKEEQKALLRGGYLYLWEAGGAGIRYRFEIEEFYDGQEDFGRIVSDPVLSRYLPSWRKYSGEDLRKVLAGEKCGSFILLRSPQQIGPVDLSSLKKWDGTWAKATSIRGSGMGILVEE